MNHDHLYADAIICLPTLQSVGEFSIDWFLVEGGIFYLVDCSHALQMFCLTCVGGVSGVGVHSRTQ